MVVAEHEHRRRESDAFGARGDIAEGRQRIPVAASPPLSLARRHSDMLPARQMVVPEAVCRTRDSYDFVDSRRDLPVSMRPRDGPEHRRHNRDLHSILEILRARGNLGLPSATPRTASATHGRNRTEIRRWPRNHAPSALTNSSV
jgi:hypothetical protein